MKTIFFCITLVTSFLLQSQSQFDGYKYIVVPNKFDVFKEENQFETTTLVKSLFIKRGFTTVYEDSMPTDINSNRCLGLYVDLTNFSSMYITKKASLILRDCSGKEVFTTKQGKSKRKDNKTAFSEVIHAAMESFDNLSYSHKPKASTTEKKPLTVSFKNDIKRIDEKPRLVVCKTKIIQQEATLDKQSFKDRTPISSSTKKATNFHKGGLKQDDLESIGNTRSFLKNALMIQEIPNGYHLVDSESKTKLEIQKSSIPDVYIAKADGKDGIVYTKNKQWFFEYYIDDKRVTKALKIKF